MSFAMRSRAVKRPFLCCPSTDLAPPPWRICSSSFFSAVRRAIMSRLFFWNAGDFVSTCVSMIAAATCWLSLLIASGTLRSGGDTLADKIDDGLRGGFRKKNFGNAGVFQSWNVGLGNNPADQHRHVIHAFCAQEFHEPRAECVVRARKNRKPDYIDIFLYRR